MFVVVLAAMAANAESCKLEDAVYQQRGSTSISARFVPVQSNSAWPAGIAMKLHFGNTGRTYWWLPWAGGSNGRLNLASTSDVTAPGWKVPEREDSDERPLGDVTYMGMDAAYNILETLPRRGAAAPAHFHVPDLRQALWYRTPPSSRDAETGQFFDLVGCASSAKDARP